MSLNFTKLAFHALFLTLTLMLPYLGKAQVKIPNSPHAQKYKDLITQNVPTVQMPAINLTTLQQEDAADEAANVPPRFGKRFGVNLNMEQHGRWDDLPNGGRIWRLAIESTDAISLNLTYDDFYMPKGGRFFIFTEDFAQILGGYSPDNNKVDGKFATGLIFAEKIILGYYEPRAARGQGRISIDGVIHGYRNIPVPEFDKFNFNRNPSNENSDLIDAICAAGSDWKDQIKSVAVAVVGGGNRWCTGALIANTTRDERLLFLTANNCLVGSEGAAAYDAISNPSLSNWIFQWNYEKNICNGSVPSVFNSTTGATVLANSSPNAPQIDGADFALLQLIESPLNAGYDVFFSGWDATGTSPQGGTSIHHPDGAPKKIVVENAALDASTAASIVTENATTLTHWKVDNWDMGALERSSKGAPLYDKTNGRIVGQFSGKDNSATDYFGQLSYAWNNGNANDARRRLQDWLDPNSSGQTTQNGYYRMSSCSNPVVVTCDDRYDGNTVNGQNNFQDYGGITGRDAKEVVHSFTPNASGLTVITMRGMSDNLDLFLLSSCNPNSLIASSTKLSTNSESIMANLSSGTTYYIVVDGKSPVESSYILETGCMEPCESPLPISCGEQKTGSTVDMKNYYSIHGISGPAWTGGEVVYEFTTTGGMTTIDLTGLNAELDLFLLDVCDPVNSEVARSTNGNLTNESISLSLLTGTYYIMIDGFNGAGGDYVLDLNCPSGGTCSNPLGLLSDQTFSGNTVAGENNFEQHGAFPGWDGEELIYIYTADETGPFDITLSNLTSDLDLFVLSSCDPVNAEIASSTQSGLSDESINVNLVSGLTYYIMVDGFAGSPGAFNLILETPTACDAPTSLDCADFGGPLFGISGSTINVDDDYLFHGGNNIEEYRGGDVVYSFLADAGTVTIQLLNLNDNLDIFLLQICDQVQNEVARSTNSGTGSELISTTVSAGMYYIMVDGYEDAESDFTITLQCNRPPILLRTKVSLEGAYKAIDGRMTDNLRSKITTVEPFTALGFTHVRDGGGEEINPMILVNTGDDAIMDWVFVELRENTFPSLVVSTRAALLQRDGDVVDIDGVSPVEFSDYPDSYYVSVKARNHLGVMTDMPVMLSYE